MRGGRYLPEIGFVGDLEHRLCVLPHENVGQQKIPDL